MPHRHPSLPPFSRRAFITTALGTSFSTILKGQQIDDSLIIYQPDSDVYQRLNTPFNSDLSFTPAAIAACTDEASVATAIRYARQHNLKVSIKSGGHSFTGSSLINNGLVIDVSAIRQKFYRPKDHTFHAGPGLKLGEIYDYLLTNNRLLPAGSCSGVGLSGLTLGGGYGFFARQHGLTCDHLQQVKMVDATGKVLNSANDPDLLWACRGGGNGNLGVITSMKFSTVPAPPKFTTQKFRATKLTPTRAVALLKGWFQIAAALPNPMFSGFILNGSNLTIIISSTYPHTGPAFQRAKNALLNLGTTTRGVYSKPTITAVKTYSGRPNPLPFRNMSAGYYHGFADLENVAHDLMQATISNPGILFQINTLGGAINTPDISAAYPHRHYPFLGELQSYWQTPAHKAKLMPAVDHIRTLLTHIPHHYANYPDPDLPNPAKAYYSTSLEKLQQLKQKLDPTKFFSDSVC
ncbi:MAG: FAD-binding protein [Akkermansiaceae bacterium]